MFDSSKRDSQSTEVTPLLPEQFDFDAYADYAKNLDKRVERFVKADSGVLVYRRFRVAEVFGYECRDRELSLRLQLGALAKSMDYTADISNFLEPWYGYAYGAAAFGADYIWKDGQAPVSSHPFEHLDEALAYDPVPIENTKVGKEQLDYIEYFLDMTKGRLPLCMSDVSGPLDVIGAMMPTTELFLDMLEDPETYSELAERVADLMQEYLLKQREMIGDALVYPGHGFASSSKLIGTVASEDTSIMISNELFEQAEVPHMVKMCEPFGGSAFHSCGNWEKKITSVLKIPGLTSADGAFSDETDPSPNNPKPFGEAFAGTGKILNVRIVGNADKVVKTVKDLWKPGMKLIVCTYCQTPQEQMDAYERIHEICK